MVLIICVLSDISVSKFYFYFGRRHLHYSFLQGRYISALQFLFFYTILLLAQVQILNITATRRFQATERSSSTNKTTLQCVIVSHHTSSQSTSILQLQDKSLFSPEYSDMLMNQKFQPWSNSFCNFSKVTYWNPPYTIGFQFIRVSNRWARTIFYKFFSIVELYKIVCSIFSRNCYRKEYQKYTELLCPINFIIDRKLGQ